MSKLTPQQAKIVKAKVEAEITDKTQSEIARELYPNATQESANVMVSRELKKVNVQEALQKALERHGLTVDSVVSVVGDAMQANKDSYVDKNGNERGGGKDHSIRLKAAGMASNFMGINKNLEGATVHFHQHIQDKKADYDF